MHAMRHSDLQLTMKLYRDAQQFEQPLAEAIARLPWNAESLQKQGNFTGSHQVMQSLSETLNVHPKKIAELFSEKVFCRFFLPAEPEQHYRFAARRATWFGETETSLESHAGGPSLAQ